MNVGPPKTAHWEEHVLCLLACALDKCIFCLLFQTKYQDCYPTKQMSSTILTTAKENNLNMCDLQKILYT